MSQFCKEKTSNQTNNQTNNQIETILTQGETKNLLLYNKW